MIIAADHPNLEQHLNRMRLTQKIGNQLEWLEFILELNKALSAPRVPTKSGVIGVHQNHCKWVARPYIDGEEKYLGNFETIELAAERIQKEFERIKNLQVKD